jgi:hypothetical protein
MIATFTFNALVSVLALWGLASIVLALAIAWASRCPPHHKKP